MEEGEVDMSSGEPGKKSAQLSYNQRAVQKWEEDEKLGKYLICLLTFEQGSSPGRLYQLNSYRLVSLQSGLFISFVRREFWFFVPLAYLLLLLSQLEAI